jgi:hypothetical protein
MPTPTLIENKNPHHPSLKKREVDLYKIIKSSPNKDSDWTKDDVIKYAKCYLVHGNMRKAAEEVKLGQHVVRRWMAKDWFPILLEEIKYMKNIALDGQYTRLVNKALQAVADRLENGDEVVVGKELVRRKVSARDAALISAIMFDKRQILRGDPTQIQQNNFNIDDRLADLTTAFETIAKKANEKVIEGEVERDAKMVGEIINLPMQMEELQEA